MRPILVLSKGRADIAITGKALQASGLPFCFVVEPQDAQEYERYWPGVELIVLDKNDQGLVYADNAALDWARGNGHEWFWRLDDNIRAFSKKRMDIDRDQECLAAEVLGRAEMGIGMDDRLALIGVEYRAFAWCQRKSYVWNRCPHCCVLTKTTTGMRYRLETETKEDIDFFLQHVTRGYISLIWEQIAMDKKWMSQNAKGGLTDAYKAHRDWEAAKTMALFWPEFCSTVVKRRASGERVDVKVDWRAVDALYGKGI